MTMTQLLIVCGRPCITELIATASNPSARSNAQLESEVSQGTC